jgi:hypothetical protein
MTTATAPTKTKKPTMATLKSFMRACNNSLHIKHLSSFDGMVDCVMPCESGFLNVSGRYDPTKRNTYGIGAWFVGGAGRNFIYLWNDDKFIGYEVSNCCGSFIIAVPRKTT